MEKAEPLSPPTQEVKCKRQKVSTGSLESPPPTVKSAFICISDQDEVPRPPPTAATEQEPNKVGLKSRSIHSHPTRVLDFLSLACLRKLSHVPPLNPPVWAFIPSMRTLHRSASS